MIALFVYFHYEIISMYTPDEVLRKEALKAMGIFFFNIYPDLYKGMLLGVIKGIGIQDKCVLVNLFCHWFAYPVSATIFVLKLDWGIFGIWSAKTVLEYFLQFWYNFIIVKTDWDKVA